MRPEPPGARALRGESAPARTAISIVVPVFNESVSLPRLHTRLAEMLRRLDRPSEVVYVDDASTDRSLEELLVIQAHDPTVRIVTLARNAGQHAAVLAGFAHAGGDIVVTIDADLQNPPEEIPRLLAEMDAGFDVVGTRRAGRADPLFRRAISAAVSRLASLAVGVPMSDCGSMLRAYHRTVVQEILRLGERALFIPALGAWVARRPTEIPVRHERRAAGRSRYSPLRFMRLGFDLMTGFSLVPIQLVSVAGLSVALLGIAFGAYLLARRVVLGPESEGLFTLFAILFVFVGILIFAVGLVGEYVGRIYMEVRRRPLYIVSGVYPPDPEEPCESS